MTKRLLWLIAIVLNVVNLLALASRIEFTNTTTLRVACAVGLDSSCVTLGWRYSRGFDVPQDPARALAIFEKACGRGGAESCRSAGDYYSGWPKGMYTFGANDERTKAFREQVRNPSRAIHFYSAGCDADSAQACDSLGIQYEEAQDNTKAIAAWTRACEINSFFGCRHLERLARDANPAVAASVIARPHSAFSGMERGMIVWIITFILSIVTGIVAAVTRAGAPAMSSRATLLIATLTAFAISAIAIYLRTTAEGKADRTIAYAVALPAILLVIGTLLLRFKGDRPSAWTFLLIGGFLSIPAGLFPILVVRESRARRVTADLDAVQT